MTVTYGIVQEDIQLLKARQDSPCEYPSCPDGREAGTDFWGCGKEASCKKMQDYLEWKANIEKANLTTLAKYLLKLDESIRRYRAADDEVEARKDAICKTFGRNILHLLDEQLYEGLL